MKYLVLSLMFFATSAFAAETKIAYVDLQKAIQSTKEGKKARANLEKDFKTREKALQKKEEDLQKMSQDMQKKAAVLSEDAKRKLQADFQKEMLEFRKKVSESQQEIANKEREMTEPILRKMADVIAKLAQKDGYTLVLEKREQNILWADSKIDITDDVVKAFEK